MAKQIKENKREAPKARHAGSNYLPAGTSRGLVLLLPLLLLLGYSPTWFRYLLQDTQHKAITCFADNFGPHTTSKSYPNVATVEKAMPSLNDSLPHFLDGRKDINTAAAAALTEAKYVGTVLSTQIVLYREQLGGFYHLNQLDEVRGLSHRAIQNIRAKYKVYASSCCRRLPVNRANKHTLLGHPYLNEDEVRHLIAYRKAHGLITNRDALLSVLQGNKHLLQRISAYVDYK